ncbi:MAG: hypothetical protein K2Y29_16740 [Beijerinckiaceae bacterium]|nr:hypothetical protein [Beijerinckiaceae bacterium]
MRFLFGIMVGVALTIGGAWIIDHRQVAGLDGPLVNWAQVHKGWTDVRESARYHVRRITG